MSRDTIRANSMDGTQTFMSRSSLTKTQTENQDGFCSDQSSRNKKPCELTNQSPEKDEQQLNENVKSTTQADDETLLNVIESADLDQAVRLLKGDNHFSQDGLDRALISACRHGFKFVVQELVCLGSNVQANDPLGNTPLLICAESGFVDIVRFLLKLKADVNASNCAGDTALILSMRPAGSLEMVRVLLDPSGIDTSHQNRDGYTALMKAVEARDVDVIKILMDTYIKEEVDGSNSRQACEPCCLGSLEAVNSEGMTAQEIADKRGLGNIYNILKTHTKFRLTLLDTVIERKDAESLNILLNCQFVEMHEIQTSFVNIFKNVNLKENKTFTEKEIMIIKTLLKYGAEVDKRWYGGSTLLSVAVNMGDYDLVELLCQHLDQQEQLRSGSVSEARIEAAKLGHWDLFDLFFKYNAYIPVMQETEPGLQETEPGLQETDPGLQETEPGLQETEPGLQETEPGLQETEKQSDHPNSMDGTQTFMSRSSLTKTQTETQDGICSDQCSSNKQCKLTNQSPEKDEQQLNENVKSTTQADDETLLNVIESADLDQAVQLLKGDNHFSQVGLDRALISACRHGLKFLVQELVCLGANVQVKDPLGNTPLLICAESGFVDIVRFLLKKKADVNASNCAGDTALILSMRPAGSLEMVRVLLDQSGIDISRQNRDGYTALMKAVEARDVDVIKILMDRYKIEEICGTTSSRETGNDWYPGPVEAVNSEGMTTQEIANKCGLGNIYNMLITHTQTRMSLLDTVIKRTDTESLNILLNCHFIEKEEIQWSFENIFKNVIFKKIIFFTEKEIMIIKSLLKYGAEVDTGWYGASAPLSIAVKMGDYDLVKLLCQHLNQQQQLRSEGVSEALIEAAKLGRCDLIDLLLKYNAYINNNNCYPGSPLDCALSHGHLESAKLLVQHGAKMDIGCALYSAVTHQLPEYMNFVLENYQPEVISFAAKWGGELNRLLLSLGGNLEIIGRLLDAGADVNYKEYRETPLGESKDGDVARFLINRGATLITLIDGAEPTLLQVLNNRNTKDSSSIEVVKVLLENGASVNESGNEDRTPLMAAASRKEIVDLLQFLLDHGADINSQDKRGNTALMEAVRSYCPLNVSFLLEFHKEKSLPLNVQNNEGKTALMFAVIEDNPEILKQLIDFGAAVNIKDEEGNTPLHYSITRSYLSTKILTTLIKAGSDVNCQNNEGLSPLMLAARNCREYVITILLDSGADVNAVSEKDSTKTSMSFLPDYKDYVKGCIEAFLSKGASSSYMKSDVLHRMIIAGEIDLIPELIQHGLGPADVETKIVIVGITTHTAISTVSPLSMSLLAGNVSLARYFVGNLFLTYSDVTTLTGNKTLRDKLQRGQQQNCLKFLEELSSQPLSLFQLAFVTVSSAVGSSPGREDRVNLLPLPQAMKDKLLFKSQEIQLEVSTTANDYLLQNQGIITFDINDMESESSRDSDEFSDYNFHGPGYR